MSIMFMPSEEEINQIEFGPIRFEIGPGNKEVIAFLNRSVLMLVIETHLKFFLKSSDFDNFWVKVLHRFWTSKCTIFKCYLKSRKIESLRCENRFELRLGK